MTLRALSPLALLALLAGPVACSAEAGDPEADDEESAIIGGQSSGSSDDAVVAIYRRNQLYCTGTLVAKNVVATALYCVSERDEAARTAVPMLGDRVRPTELTIRMGTKPTSKTSATVSKVIVTDPVKAESGVTVPMTSNNIAFLYVQPVDPAFSKIVPRRVATRSVEQGAMVTVVGYGGASEQVVRGGSPERLRKDVEVKLGVKERGQDAEGTLENGQTVTWKNKSREFVTSTVACGGDNGGPAFDSQGSLVGLVSAVIGSCVEGSLSVFTDVPSHAAFVQKSISEAKTIGCLNDDECGNATSGQVCDGKTNRCMRGCRAGGNGCANGATCSVQGRTSGAQGICRSTSSAQDASDPSYDLGAYVPPALPGLTCPGNPLCPTTPPTRECRVDDECRGVNGSKPRVCDIPAGRCLDGCRVATAGMCAVGQTCGAYEEDPLIGICQLAKPAAPPPGPPASPPVLQSEPPVAAPAATTEAPAVTAAAKKKKSAAKADDGGCSVSASSNRSASAWLTLAAPMLVALLRRRRRAG